MSSAKYCHALSLSLIRFVSYNIFKIIIFVFSSSNNLLEEILQNKLKNESEEMKNAYQIIFKTYMEVK